MRTNRLAQVLSVLLPLVCLLSCAHDRALTAITVTPATVKFLTPQTNLVFQLTAIGTFAHPPGNFDITNKVTWTTAAPQIVTVSSSGVVTPSGTGSCGVVNVTATAPVNSNNSSLVIGAATITVADPSNTHCPQ